MADSSGMVKVLLVAGAGYVAYEMGWLSMFGLTPAASASTSAASSTTVPTTTAPAPVTVLAAAPKAPSLATVYAQLLAAASAPAAGLTADQWGYYLNQILAPYNLSAPDPTPLFTAFTAATANALTNVPGVPAPSATWDRGTLYTAPVYWQVMAPALTTQYGMTGLGHLGRLAMYGRTW